MSKETLPANDHKERERQTGRQKDRQADRETETERKRDRERQSQRDRQRERLRQTERDRRLRVLGSVQQYYVCRTSVTTNGYLRPV